MPVGELRTLLSLSQLQSGTFTTDDSTLLAIIAAAYQYSEQSHFLF